MPCFFVLERLVKKETVTGIIGNTQGVIKAMSPPKNPKTNTDQALDSLLSFATSPQAPAGGVVAVAGSKTCTPAAFLPLDK